MALRSRVLLLALSAGLVLTAERAHCEPASLPRRIAAGCEAVNAGTFNLDCNVAPSGLIAGPKGSGFIFEQGDVLTLEEEATAGSLPSMHQLSLAVCDHGGSNLVSAVPVSPEHVIHARNYWFKTRPSFSVPTTCRHWCLLTAGSGLGAGAYRLTLRCGHGHISSIENTLPVSVRAS